MQRRFMLRRGRAALALMIAPSAAAAQSQPVTSTHDIIRQSSEPGLEEIANSDAALRDTVDCIVENLPDRTRNLLATVPGSYAEQRILVHLRSRAQSCYDYMQTGGRALVIQYNIVRGMIAEVYYRRLAPNGITAATGTAPEALADWTAARPVDGEISGTEAVHAMARCVTARQPAEVSALLATVPMSGPERAAMRALQDDLPGCLAAGVELAASRQSLRGLFSEAALHYVQARGTGFAPITSMADND